ncbi:ribosomal subunit interface protein [bacterium CG10_46_32]|nr:MAG: ribosomal subunit interface protein [bacterium CG10_46_32]PIR55761.1 MAG: ribosomal subunit interface protein [Parcubacteria group bacterium CG10_big_fil_rev_8_21_14_0_10_46_32]
MKIQFYTKNVELPEKLKDQFEEKLLSLKKYKGNVDVLQVRVDVSRDQHHKSGDVYRVEVNIDVPGTVLRSVETAADILSALDVVAEKLERQSRDLKDKIITKRKRGQ